jgi:ubiquinone/menaquinone biosynthesis C-methylase UbiE
MIFMRRFMRIFFYLLYHPFAFLYDLVAATVSFGRWRDWVISILPFLHGSRILELGHGPGHLQRFLLDRGFSPFGLDESTQMGRLARRKLGLDARLTRGLAQSLPFPDDSFDTIVSTFPTDYIFEQSTLSGIRRCLSDGGRLIVLPVAWPKSRLLKWLYKVTGESPAELEENLKARIRKPFEHAGFHTEMHVLEVKSGILLVVIASK